MQMALSSQPIVAHSLMSESLNNNDINIIVAFMKALKRLASLASPCYVCVCVCVCVRV